jgi:hypothetical protein
LSPLSWSGQSCVRDRLILAWREATRSPPMPVYAKAQTAFLS